MSYFGVLTDKFNKTSDTCSIFCMQKNFRIPGTAGCNLYFTWKHKQFWGQLIGFVMKNGRQPRSRAKLGARNRSAERLVLHCPDWHIEDCEQKCWARCCSTHAELVLTPENLQLLCSSGTDMGQVERQRFKWLGEGA